MPGIEDLAKCAICKDTFKSPLALPCKHSFCKGCLADQAESGKITCLLCSRTHPVAKGNVEKAFTNSSLGDFLLKVTKNDYARGGADSDDEETGTCPECAPKETKKPTKKEGDASEEPAPILVKLQTCHHCSKKLCESCRSKHYQKQRADTLNKLEKYEENASSILMKSEQVDVARKAKLQEYNATKESVKAKHLEIINKLKEEEAALLKRLSDEITEENNKINQANIRRDRVRASRETAKTLRDKLNKETSMKVMANMCNDFTKADGEWQAQLDEEGLKLDPKKDLKIIYEPPDLKKPVLGTIEQKKNTIKTQVPGEKSKICTIQ